jgi:hypothetical protein
VEFPAAEPLITAAGGTTLPKALFEEFPDEAAWGLAYFFGFPVGTGGGVSSYFPRPVYQLGIPGMLNTEPGQIQISFTRGTDGRSTPGVRIPLPNNFPGRNVPDLSLNSDPNTGYTVFYTSDVTGFEVLSGFGGTSFASPQLSAVTSLLDQALGRRLGLLNFRCTTSRGTIGLTAGRLPPCGISRWGTTGTTRRSRRRGTPSFDVVWGVRPPDGLLLRSIHPEQRALLDREVVRGSAPAKNGLRGCRDIETIAEQPSGDVYGNDLSEHEPCFDLSARRIA